MSTRRATAVAVYRRWLRRYVPVAMALLGGSILVGFLLGSAVPAESLPVAEQGGSNGLFPPLTTTALAINNLTAMVVLLLGAVSLGLLTVIGLVVNGLLIGAVVGIAVQQIDPIVVLALIVPHGVFEIPALLVVSAVGLRFAWLSVRYIRGLDEELVGYRDFQEAGWLVAVAALLIVVGAYIEANVTLELAERIAGEELSNISNQTAALTR